MFSPQRDNPANLLCVFFPWKMPWRGYHVISPPSLPASGVSLNIQKGCLPMSKEPSSPSLTCGTGIELEPDPSHLPVHSGMAAWAPKYFVPPSRPPPCHPPPLLSPLTFPSPLGRSTPHPRSSPPRKSKMASTSKRPTWSSFKTTRPDLRNELLPGSTYLPDFAVAHIWRSCSPQSQTSPNMDPFGHIFLALVLAKFRRNKEIICCIHALDFPLEDLFWDKEHLLFFGSPGLSELRFAKARTMSVSMLLRVCTAKLGEEEGCWIWLLPGCQSGAPHIIVTGALVTPEWHRVSRTTSPRHLRVSRNGELSRACTCILVCHFWWGTMPECKILSKMALLFI